MPRFKTWDRRPGCNRLGEPSFLLSLLNSSQSCWLVWTNPPQLLLWSSNLVWIAEMNPIFSTGFLLLGKTAPQNLMVIISQFLEFGHSFYGWFWLRTFPEVAVKTLGEATVIWRLDWGWRTLFQVSSIPPKASVLVLLLAGGLSSLPDELPLRVCWNFLTTWQLDFPGASDPRWHGGSYHAFYDLALGVTHHHFCHILFVESEFLCPAHTQGEGN